MKTLKSTILFLTGILMSALVLAQQPDITGVWKGELIFKDSIVVHLPYEIAVSENKNKLQGYSRITFHANGKDEFGIQNFSIKWEGDEVIMEDEGFIEHGFSANPSKHVKKTLVMKLVVSDTEMILSGDWSTNRTRRYMKQASGTVQLKRRVDFKASELVKRLDTLKIAETLSFINRPEESFVVKPAPRPEIKKETTPVVVLVPPVAEPDAIPEEPELIIPRLTGTVTIVKIPIDKKRQPAVTKIARPTAQQKTKMDALAKTVLKPIPKPEVPPPVAKPVQPVTVAAVTPQPEKKAAANTTAPTRQEPVAKKADPPVATTPQKPADVAAVQPRPDLPKPAFVAPSATVGAAEIDKRITKTDQSVYFETDSLVLTLYDNGEVDGDIVTVLMNGNVIFSKVLLTTKPNTKTIYITPDMDSVNLVMYAESLGDIPPNTGLLIVNDGEKRYDVRFSADLKTNAGIILRRRKG
ncbi:MAG TPA: hypothetical protein PKC39_03255 [Ferruginibacter sp.]|nr:hypothetical protein [Ferruginibacter sp.]HMP19956.1 hypothetical protein [Ferruginibacter sp.]